jgi:hypothetical protein
LICSSDIRANSSASVGAGGGGTGAGAGGGGGGGGGATGAGGGGGGGAGVAGGAGLLHATTNIAMTITAEKLKSLNLPDDITSSPGGNSDASRSVNLEPALPYDPHPWLSTKSRQHRHGA